jgi:hypothetical protein
MSEPDDAYIEPSEPVTTVSIIAGRAPAQLPENIPYFLVNGTRDVVDAQIRVTVAAFPPRNTDRPTVRLQPGERLYLGGSCAFDVEYTNLCGSLMTYQLLNWRPVRPPA